MKKLQVLRCIGTYLATALILSGLCGCRPNDPYSSRLNSTVTTTPSGKKITSIEADGNLEVTHVLKCIPLQSIVPEYTPADIHGAIQNCVKKGDYKSAFDLFKVAGSYATFDTLRVADKTAHQAKAMLAMRTHLALSQKEREKFEVYIKTHSSYISDVSLCKSIKKLGPPTYYPRYMIQHGLGAISGNKGEPLVKNFNAEDAWVQSLKVYLHCNL